MKNLYERIGLSGSAVSIAEIRLAIEHHLGGDSGDARAAEFVLLNEDRKKVYDSAHQTLVRIGQIRANLGLLRGAHWQRSDCNDFNATTRSRTSQLLLWRNKLLSEPRTSPAAQVTAWLVIGLIVALTVFAVVYEWNPAPRPVSQRTPPTFPESRAVDPAPSVDPHETRRTRTREFVAKRIVALGETAEPELVGYFVDGMMAGKVEALPPTGVLSRDHVGPAVAPLEIRTSPGLSYYVKLVPWNSKKVPAITAFIRDGEPLNIEVPLGSFEIRYAAGKEWYGPMLDFGLDATYSRCDERFDFRMSEDGYTGYTVELILQLRGNLHTETIRADDF